jgi:formylglycine-generating enzyme required for sulfatase activity/tRNA A-37 threonylcarbamoyl transferase component Bud32
MSVATTADLLSALRRHRLLEPAQLAELGRAPAADARALARELVKRGWLTPYQVNELFQGRGEGLALGAYVLLEKLGEGGMGAVFKARHRKLGRVVALKRIRKERLGNELAVKRFRRECLAAAQFDHPNVVRAYDADEDGGTHFFVMEYVEGLDLARLVKDKGPLPVAEACDYVRQAALGLQHAHEKGLVHRDIKPHNLLLASRGVHPPGLIKVLDLGLARLGLRDADGESASPLTQDGALMGTPDYVAPEQARDARSADIRSDLYSLGCTLYHLLAGRVPFGGGTLTEKLLSHQMDPVPDVRRLRPDVPEAVAHVVTRLMAKKPEDRYQTPAELAGALEEALRGRPIAGFAAPPAPRRRPAGADGPFTNLDRSLTPTTPAPAGRRSRLLLAATAAAGLLLGAVILAAWLLSRGGKPDPVAGPERAATEAESPPKGVSAEQVEAARKLGVRVQIDNSIGMKLNLIPAGRFLMGSPDTEPGREGHEGPPHEVEITQPFYAGVHEVTVGQFRQFVKATGYRTEAETSGRGAHRLFPDGWRSDPKVNWKDPGFEQAEDHPVVCVSWNDAVAFCAWLSGKEGKSYALPTEAQWEYACRAGSRTKFSFGDDDNELARYGWWGANSGMRTHPVGQKKSNAWGLCDMHGNAWEWCADCYDADFYRNSPRRDPRNDVKPGDNRRVERSGSWGCTAAGRCRSAYRNTNEAGVSGTDLGFRAVCAVPSAAKP